ncbi:DUF6493 family protein [Hymenobacter sp. H14-R3]|uniref:DUF6493 family protein n=1 Tax=Hymenobacter sp. H14-R3 TaxID=3046308 RepID=UPI0024BA2F5B|nr:DUF6493 family protein [Hymenobacter sp. H14-R3]MDJ0365794.1 DUF6493 family protein [Hymenobacter sp. H14-R3]
MADSVVEIFEQLVRLPAPLPEMATFLLGLDPKDIVAIRKKTKQLAKKFDTGNVPETWALLFMAGLASYARQEALQRSFSSYWNGDFLEAAFGQKRYQGPCEPLLTVLRHARPPWLTDWLLGLARTFTGQVLPYTQLRTLADEGLITYDPWLFAQALARRLDYRNAAENDRPNLTDYLLAQFRADALLLTRDLPLLFDYDTRAEEAEMMGPTYRESITWLTLIPELIASGHLHRADILTRCLLALRRDFHRALLTWFKNLYLSLQPTRAEQLAHQAELLALVEHSLPLVVNFALGQLKDLCLDPGFRLAALLLPAESLLARPDVAASLVALLTSLGRVLRSAPAQAPTVARLYAAALAHPAAAVQDRAAKGLAALLAATKSSLSSPDRQAVIAALGDAAGQLGATARALLAPWLAAPPAAGAATAADYAPLLDFVPDLSATTAVVPVADWPELLFLTGQVLKHDDALALERWLDGLLRLRSRLPPHYAPALRPYLQQLWPKLKGKTEAETEELLREPALAVGHAGLVQALLLSWARGFAAPLVPGIHLRYDSSLGYPYKDLFTIIADPLVAAEQQRLAFAETLLREQRALPLLSTPSHAPHWVSPNALITRLLTYEATGQSPHPVDLAVALARTAHAHPTEAAAALAQLPRLRHAGLRALLAWLLGPVAEPLPAGVADLADPTAAPAPGAGAAALAAALPQLWAVAARTKQPAGEFPGLAGVAAAGVPGVVHPWQPSWWVGVQSRTYKQPWGPDQPDITQHWTAVLLALPLTPAPVPPTLLYSLAATVPLEAAEPFVNLDNYAGALADDYPFLGALLPQYPAPLHWHTLRISNTDTLSAATLTSLLGPGPCFEEAATLLLARTLGYQNALAVEVLLAATKHRRLVPAALGRVLGKMLAGDFADAGHLAKNLAQTRASSPAADAVLSQLFATLLAELPATPLPKLRLLLETYADLLARTQQPVPAPVQAQLGAWQATASLRKISRTLLAQHAA